MSACQSHIFEFAVDSREWREDGNMIRCHLIIEIPSPHPESERVIILQTLSFKITFDIRVRGGFKIKKKKAVEL